MNVHGKSRNTWNTLVLEIVITLSDFYLFYYYYNFIYLIFSSSFFF